VVRYEDEPAPDVLRADQPDLVRHKRSGKGRNQWCRKRKGLEHIPGEPTPDHDFVNALIYEKPHYYQRALCYPRPWWSRRIRHYDAKSNWWCHHYIRCTRCQKILKRGLGTDCPDYDPKAEDK